jgi:hypothetical protein
MKDKELRQILEDSGVISVGMYRDGESFINPVPIRDILNALIEYLGVNIINVPDHMVAKKKEAPQNIIEAAHTSANSTK